MPALMILFWGGLIVLAGFLVYAVVKGLWRIK